MIPYFTPSLPLGYCNVLSHFQENKLNEKLWFHSQLWSGFWQDTTDCCGQPLTLKQSACYFIQPWAEHINTLPASIHSTARTGVSGLCMPIYILYILVYKHAHTWHLRINRTDIAPAPSIIFIFVKWNYARGTDDILLLASKNYIFPPKELLLCKNHHNIIIQYLCR